MKTITLWNVPVDRALKMIEIMKEEANEALKAEEYNKVSDLMYEINRIVEAIAIETEE